MKSNRILADVNILPTTLSLSSYYPILYYIIVAIKIVMNMDL